MWRIKRLDTTGDHSGLDCVEATSIPTTVILENTTTGLVEVLQMCWDIRSANKCDNLRALAAGGHTPNDWTAECPPL